MEVSKWNNVEKSLLMFINYKFKQKEETLESIKQIVRKHNYFLKHRLIDA